MRVGKKYAYYGMKYRPKIQCPLKINEAGRTGWFNQLAAKIVRLKRASTVVADGNSPVVRLRGCEIVDLISRVDHY